MTTPGKQIAYAILQGEPMEKKSGRFAIIEQLIKDGICLMFGNPGTTEQGILDAAGSYPDFQYILTLQESIALAMADGYARAVKKPTAVQLHTGVGLGNGIGMLYQAMRGHSPLVVIACEAGLKYETLQAQMAADLVGMAKPVTKWATKVNSHQNLLRTLRRAIKVAATPPMGPVFVALPADVLDAPVAEEVLATSILTTTTCPGHEELETMARILCRASKPMFIIGDGIARSQAQTELEKISAQLGAQVWGADCSEVNINAALPQFKGLLGHMFGFHSQAITSQADVIFICGTYVFPEVFPVLEGAFAPRAKIIHIDPDSDNIAKNFNVDIGIVSDPRTTLARLSQVLADRMTDDQKKAATQRIEKYRLEKEQAYQKTIANDQSRFKNIPMSPAPFMHELSQSLNEDPIIFDEALTSSPELNRYFPAQKSGHFFQTRGGSLGVGIPGALGLKLAHPEKTVIGFTGDGGSMYTIQALWSAAHHKIGAKFVICNNHSYKLLKLNIMEYWKEQNLPDHDFPAPFDLDHPPIDFTYLAKAMGVPALRVERPQEIKHAIQTMLNTEGPFLIDLVINNQVAGHEVGCKCGQ